MCECVNVCMYVCVCVCVRVCMSMPPKFCNSDDVSMRDPHYEVMLSGRTSHTRVESISYFVPKWICRVGYGDVSMVI